MTRHALAAHAPDGAVFAVSSFGSGALGNRPPAELHPLGLEGPLGWVAEQLEAGDRADMEQLWKLAPADVPSSRALPGGLRKALSALEPVVRVPRPAEEAGEKARLAADVPRCGRGDRRRGRTGRLRTVLAFERARSFEKAGEAPAGGRAAMV